MFAFILRRIFQAAVVVVAVAGIAFLLFQDVRDPVVFLLGQDAQPASLIAFAIVTETVFQWRGMGLPFTQAVTFADLAVMAASLCLTALIFVAIDLVVDLLYCAVDPRLRVGPAGGH